MQAHVDEVGGPELTMTPGAAATWTESDGVTVSENLASGFGVTFVKRTIEHEMQGTADLQPVTGGLRWTLEFPVVQKVPHT